MLRCARMFPIAIAENKSPSYNFRIRVTFRCGEGGIRTHGPASGTTVFETARFNHSRTSPMNNNIIKVLE